MTQNQKFEKITTAILGELSDQLMKIIQKGSLVDMYFNISQRLMDAQKIAYDDGYKRGRADVMDEVIRFDNSKDELGS
jgi:hypothetical protein